MSSMDVFKSLPIDLQIEDGFFDEENRDGYIVNESMKKVWAIELDLLEEFSKVCKKYGIKYFADGGTLLGAVRHKGFIPWDDDIDLVLMRDQYETLCKIASSEFKGRFFFQTEYTDKSSLRGHAQLRNRYTTAILESELAGKHDFNQGIFIDIFPLDSVPEDNDEFKKKIELSEKYLKTARSMANLTDVYTPTPAGKPVKALIKKAMHTVFSGPLKFLVNYDYYYNQYEQVCVMGNDQLTEKVAKFFYIPFLQEQVWNRADFNSEIMMPFEMCEIPVPVGYKRILSTFFGDDWRVPKQIGTAHSGVVFDVNTSYIDYKRSLV